MVDYEKPQSLRERRNDPTVIFEKAVAAHDGGRLADAEWLYGKILLKDPSHFAAVCRLGVVYLQQTRFREAASLFRRAIQLDERSADAHHYLAFVLTGLNQSAEAKLHYETALALRPDFVEAHNNLGHLFQRDGSLEQAILQFQKALELRPDYPEAHNNMGNILNSLGLTDEATGHYRKAIAANPKYSEAYWNLANSLRSLNRPDEAIEQYEQAIQIRPNYPEAYNGLANTLRHLDRNEDAVVHYEKAISLRPTYVDAHANLADLLGHLGRHDEAMQHFDRALALDPTNVDVLVKRGNMFNNDGRYRDAFDSFERAAAIDSDNPNVLNGMTQAASSACNWSRSEPLTGELVAYVEQGGLADPHFFLSCSGDPLTQLTCAETFSGALAGGPQARLWRNLGQGRLWNDQRWQNPRIRLAYLSSKFHDPSIAQLTANLLDHHDRSKFELIGISLGPMDDSDARARIRRSFDAFYDLTSKTDNDIAKQINDMAVDILVDRDGFGATARPGIALWRPSPIQVNFGFPGTLGTSYDYIIADPIVIPFDQEPFYPEKLVYLPMCCLPTDPAGLALSDFFPDASARQREGLPEQGLVFCCFNEHFKIGPSIFNIWMSLLRQVNGSVLWLLGGNDEAEDNLRKHAGAHGIDPARLVFAPEASHRDHLMRHPIADLFLDTTPYGGRITARNALLSGVPVLTCLGATFSGRVAASLLDSVGLPELIATDLQQYEALALRLASEPALLQRLRVKLRDKLGNLAASEGIRYCRSIEAAYTAMWQLWQDGEDSRSFSVLAKLPD